MSVLATSFFQDTQFIEALYIVAFSLFIVGLIGKDLYPLSAIVQTMRKTQQTSLYLERLGPFFVGRALWQSAE